MLYRLHKQRLHTHHLFHRHTPTSSARSWMWAQKRTMGCLPQRSDTLPVSWRRHRLSSTATITDMCEGGGNTTVIVARNLHAVVLQGWLAIGCCGLGRPPAHRRPPTTTHSAGRTRYSMTSRPIAHRCSHHTVIAIVVILKLILVVVEVGLSLEGGGGGRVRLLLHPHSPQVLRMVRTLCLHLFMISDWEWHT